MYNTTSNNIKVFPTSNRDKKFTSYSGLNTEQNITSLVNRFTRNQSYVIKSNININEGTLSGKFNICGYYIEIKESVDITNELEDNTYLYLKMNTATDVSNNISNLRIDGVDKLLPPTEEQSEENLENSEYTGLEIIGTTRIQNDTNYKKYLKLAEKINNEWVTENLNNDVIDTDLFAIDDGIIPVETLTLTLNNPQGEITLGLNSNTIPLVNWGDGTINRSLTHEYNQNETRNNEKTIIVTSGDYINLKKNIISSNDENKNELLQNITIGPLIKEIGDYTFDGCINLEEITIPNNITSMGKAVFQNCYNEDRADSVLIKWGDNPQIKTLDYLNNYEGKSIIIPKSIKTIPNTYDFFRLENLQDIKISEGIEKVQMGAFTKCIKLNSIELPFIGSSNIATTPSKETLFGYIFGKTAYNGGTITRQYYGSDTQLSLEYADYCIPNSLNKVIINDNLTLLRGAFYNCRNINNVEMYNVGTIPLNCFNNCETLTNIKLSESLEIINSYAFKNCYNLKSIKIPNSVTTINIKAFENCYRLVEIYDFTSGNNALNITAGDSQNNGGIGCYAKIVNKIDIDTKIIAINNIDYFSNDGEIIAIGLNNFNSDNITIDNTCNKINDYAFYNYNKLHSLQIDSSLINITVGNNVFENTELNIINIPTTLISYIPKTYLVNITFNSGDTLIQGHYIIAQRSKKFIYLAQYLK